MLREMSDTERKLEAVCCRTMPCEECAKLTEEFGKKKVDTAISGLGPKVSALSVRMFLDRQKLAKMFDEYDIETAIMALGEGAPIADITRYIRTERLNPENS